MPKRNLASRLENIQQSEIKVHMADGEKDSILRVHMADGEKIPF